MDLPRITVEELEAMSDDVDKLADKMRLMAEVYALRERLAVEGIPSSVASGWDKLDELELQLRVSQKRTQLLASDVDALKQLHAAGVQSEFARLRAAAEDAEIRQRGAELAREGFRRDAEHFQAAVQELTEVATEAMCRVVIFEQLHAAVTRVLGEGGAAEPMVRLAHFAAKLGAALNDCNEKLKQLDYVAPNDSQEAAAEGPAPAPEGVL